MSLNSVGFDILSWKSQLEVSMPTGFNKFYNVLDIFSVAEASQ